MSDQDIAERMMKDHSFWRHLRADNKVAMFGVLAFTVFVGSLIVFYACYYKPEP